MGRVIEFFLILFSIALACWIIVRAFNKKP